MRTHGILGFITALFLLACGSAAPGGASAQRPSSIQVAEAVIPAMRREFAALGARTVKLNRVARSVRTGADIVDTLRVPPDGRVAGVELTSVDCWAVGLSGCGLSAGEAVVMITPPERVHDGWRVEAIVRLTYESGHLGGANYGAVLLPSGDGWKVSEMRVWGVP